MSATHNGQSGKTGLEITACVKKGANGLVHNLTFTNRSNTDLSGFAVQYNKSALGFNANGSLGALVSFYLFVGEPICQRCCGTTQGIVRGHGLE